MTKFIGARISLPRLATAPSTPVSGDAYYNTVANTAYIYNGTSWVDLGAVFPISSSNPASPQAGQVYFNTATQKLYVYNGTNWVDTSVDDEHLAYVYFD